MAIADAKTAESGIVTRITPRFVHDRVKTQPRKYLLHALSLLARLQRLHVPPASNTVRHIAFGGIMLGGVFAFFDSMLHKYAAARGEFVDDLSAHDAKPAERNWEKR